MPENLNAESERAREELLRKYRQIEEALKSDGYKVYVWSLQLFKPEANAIEGAAANQEQ